MTHFGYFTVDLFDCPPFKMFSNGDDPRAVNVLEHKSFEPHSMRIWCSLAKNATAILDIGAHTGVYSLAAAALRSNIQIHAFEPNPFTAARLRVNKYANGFENIEEHFFAVAEGKGIAELSWKRKAGGWLSSGSALGPERDGFDRAPVYVRPLDSLNISPGSNPLVKIDVEGTEQNLFVGMRGFIQSRPTIILETFVQSHCDFIESLLPRYKFFLIDETGRLIEQEHLLAANPYDVNLNHLLIPAERPIP